MTDWKNNPQNTTPHESVLKELRDKDDYTLTLGQSGTVFTNLPTGAMFWDESGKLFRRWNGSQKEVRSIGVAGGGTGASDAIGARANIGADDAENLTKGRVPTARLSGSYDIDITGNAANASLLEGNNAAFYRNASNLNAGLVPSARLSGNYNISITGNAATATNADNATTASNALLLEGNNAAFYRNASNLNAGEVPTDRLPLELRITQEVVSSFASPSLLISGMCFDGQNLISCDSGTDLIYIHSGVTSGISSSFTSPSEPSSLAFDGENLIILSSVTDTIYVMDGISSSVLSQFSTEDSSVSSITFDGSNLVSVSLNGLVYIHNGITSSVSSTYSIASTSILDLSFNGYTFTACDVVANTINTYSGHDFKLLESVPSPSGSPQAICYIDGRTLTADRDTDSIYTHTSKALL